MQFRGEDLTGRVFHRLSVLQLLRHPEKGTSWLCRCECGNSVTAFGHDLRRGSVKSCGCWRRDRLFVHGYRYSRNGNPHHMYVTHQCMVARCSNPEHESWRFYGKKGITVCARWREFKNFLSDMEPTWAKGLSIDRINNKGHYSCGRCKDCRANRWPMNGQWSTSKIQSLNRSNSFKVRWRGKLLPLVIWAEQLNMPYPVLYTRLHQYRWTSQRAFTTPHTPRTALLT